MNLLLEKFSILLTERLGRKMVIVSVEKIQGGFEAEAFLLVSSSGEKFFVKKMLNGLFPENNLHNLLVSHSMMNRSNVSNNSIGVALVVNEELILTPDSLKEVYQIQHYEDLHSENYFEKLKKYADLGDINEEIVSDTKEIADLLVRIHSTKIEEFNQDEKKRLYNRSLESVLATPGMFFFFLNTFNADNKIFPKTEHSEYVSLMVNKMNLYINSENRLRVLHGDFWGTNLHKKAGGWYAVDYSRFPFGEPAIDVASFLAQYLWLYHESGNEIYKKIGEVFLNEFENISGDKDIRKFITFPLGLYGMIWITPEFYPDLDKKIASKFFGTIWKNLKSKEFCWE